jgi:hypothetical protein
VIEALPDSLPGEVLNAFTMDWGCVVTIAGGRLAARMGLLQRGSGLQRRVADVEKLVRRWGTNARCATSMEEWYCEADASLRSWWPVVVETLQAPVDTADATFRFPGSSLAEFGSDTRILDASRPASQSWREELQKRRWSLLDVPAAFQAVAAMLPSMDTSNVTGGIRVSVYGYEGVSSPFAGLPQTFTKDSGLSEVRLFRKAAKGVWGVLLRHDAGAAISFGPERFVDPFAEALRSEFIYPMDRD